MKLQNAKLVVAFMTVGGLLTVIGLGIFLIAPTLSDVHELKQGVLTAQAELEAQYANRRNLLASRDKVVETREIMKRLAAQFVPTGRELDFITAVEALASKNGVTERLQLSKAAGGTVPEFEKRFDLSLTGTFPQSLQMLIDLEKMPTLMLVDSMNIRPGSSSDGPPALMIDLHGAIAVPPRGLL